MNKKQPNTETNTKQTNPVTKETTIINKKSIASSGPSGPSGESKELQTVTKSINTINHKSKEAQQERERKFNLIIKEIETKGKGVNTACKKYGLNTNSFFNMIDKDSLLLKQYTRALELKADVIAERIIRNSHNRSNDFYIDGDGNQKPNPVAVQRDRLMLDADKWLLSKIAPKKYGDKLTLDGEVKTGQPLTIENINMILNEIKEE
jgi:hypothetical protein